MRIQISSRESGKFYSNVDGIIVEKAIDVSFFGKLLSIWTLQELDEQTIVIFQEMMDGDEWTEIKRLPDGFMAIILSEGSRLKPMIEQTDLVVQGPGSSTSIIMSEQPAGPMVDLLLSRHRSANSALIESMGAVSTLRSECEQTRESMAAVVKSLSRQVGSGFWTVLNGRYGGAENVVEIARGCGILIQDLNVECLGICSLSLHVREAAVSAESRLQVRLVSVEDRVILGSWSVPGTNIHPGWLKLELSEVSILMGQSARIEISESLRDGDKILMSLDPGLCQERYHVRDSSGRRFGSPLAVVIFAAEAGSRYVVPQFWNWYDVVGGVIKSGVMYRLPECLWQSSRIVEGDVKLVQIGDDVYRPVLNAPPLGQAIMLLPNIPAPGMDLVSIELCGSGYGLPESRVAVWFLPAGASLHDGQLDGVLDGVQWTGWRSFAKDSNTTTLKMMLLPSEGPMSAVVSLENKDENSACICEVAELSVMAFEDLNDASSVADYSYNRMVGPEIDLPFGKNIMPTMLFDEVLFGHVYENDTGDYKHIEFMIKKAAYQGKEWGELKLKLVLNAHCPGIEFRRDATRDPIFELWPGTLVDEYGDVLVLWAEENRNSYFMDKMTLPDRGLAQCICYMMPVFISRSFSKARLSPVDRGMWLNAARMMQRFGVYVGG